MLARHGGAFGVAGQAIQAFEHAPARGQCRIDVDGAQKRFDRAGRVLERHIAETTFLMQATETRL